MEPRFRFEHLFFFFDLILSPFNTPTRPNGSQVNPPTTLLQYKASSKMNSYSSLPRGFARPKVLMELDNSTATTKATQYAPFADNPYFLQPPAPASGALVPALVPHAVLGRSLLSTPLAARHLRRSQIRWHQCLRQSRPSRSAQNRVSTLVRGIVPGRRGRQSMPAHAHHTKDYPPDFCYVINPSRASNFRKTEYQVCICEFSDGPSGCPLDH